MKWIKQIYACLKDYKIWFLILIATDFLFVFLAWLAYPETFVVLVVLMIVFTLAMISFSIFIIIRKQVKIDEVFEDFLLEPNETNEERLCQVSPETHFMYISRLGNVIRSYESKLNDQVIELTDYENYIEGWVHEVKKPLSLMTLILDNRIDEMSPLVRHRMLNVRDKMLGDVEKILYFARLGTAHKDYNFESISLLAFCKEAIKNHQTLLDESGFYIHFTGEEMTVLSDRKGLTFILEQIIANSTKYITQNNDSPIMKFETVYDKVADEIILNISDNGLCVAEEDLPFIFDKGFTGRRGAYTREATGMGLFLVRKMAYDLAIHLDVESELGSGLTISLIFPNVKK